ncbi:MAG TPA: triose-phosphate isomerase [Amaricoccus sp.]|nr:triose-phosphate isomerase [Amaricoccus sp.]
MPRRKLVAGNWKMNGLASAAAMLDELPAAGDTDVLICPPATLVARLAGGRFAIGGQDCHFEAAGAHTGDISAEMLADAGAVAVIVGHSERRADHGETDALVAVKAAAAWRAGLLAIVCVGETEAERDAGRTLDRIGAQLAGSLPDGAAPDRLAVAYEPVWAIGSGRTPSPEEIAAVHGFIREALTRRFGPEAGPGFRLLYGGSVKPGNAAAIFAVPNVDGALVGGASLAAADFGAIITAAG